MVLMNFVAFVVFKILLNLVSMQNLLNANNCWHKQNLQNCPTWPHIYFQCTLRISYWFCLIFGSLSCRKYCLFHHGDISMVLYKIIFLKNMVVYNCVTMRKRARAFEATIQCITFLYTFCHWKVQFLWCTFQTHFSIGRRHFQNMVLRLK